MLTGFLVSISTIRNENVKIEAHIGPMKKKQSMKLVTHPATVPSHVLPPFILILCRP
jgi:hypothetical protein